MLNQWMSQTRIALLILTILTLIGTLSWPLDNLAFNAASLAEGQWWRPLSAWVTQLNFRHWVLNQWGVVVMAILLPEKLNRWQWGGFVVIWLFTSLALALSDYRTYVGLSGLLYGWLIWSAYLSPFYSWLVKVIFIGALSIKVFSENDWLPLPQSDWVGDFIQANVAHESHLWGLLSGFAVIVTAVCFLQYRSRLVPRG